MGEARDKDLSVYNEPPTHMICDDCKGDSFTVFFHADALEMNCDGCRSEVVIAHEVLVAICAGMHTGVGMDDGDSDTNGKGALN